MCIISMETKLQIQKSLAYINKHFDSIEAGSTDAKIVKDHLEDMKSILNKDFDSNTALLNFKQRNRFMASSFGVNSKQAMNNLFKLETKGFY